MQGELNSFFFSVHLSKISIWFLYGKKNLHRFPPWCGMPERKENKKEEEEKANLWRGRKKNKKRITGCGGTPFIILQLVQ